MKLMTGENVCVIRNLRICVMRRMCVRIEQRVRIPEGRRRVGKRNGGGGGEGMGWGLPFSGLSAGRGNRAFSV